jgi:hypothetical protein
MASMRLAVWFNVIVVALLSSETASAIDRDACAVPYEQAQVLRKQRIYLAAAEQLAACRAQCPAVLAADCAQWTAELQALTPTVRLQVHDAAGHEVGAFRAAVDGTQLTDAPGTWVASVDPGSHVFRVEAPGFLPSEVNATLREGEHGRVVDVTLTPAPRSVTVQGVASSLPSRAPGYVFGGVGLAGLATGGVLAAIGFADRQSLRDTCAPRCDPASVTKIQTLWDAGGVAAAVGAASLGVGVILFLRARPQGDTTGFMWTTTLGIGTVRVTARF